MESKGDAQKVYSVSEALWFYLNKLSRTQRWNKGSSYCGNGTAIVDSFEKIDVKENSAKQTVEYYRWGVCQPGQRR
jgi:hypothetical protein